MIHPTLTVSLLLFSMLTFIAGLLLGILCVKYFRKASPTNKAVSTTTRAAVTSKPIPEYEEVLPASHDHNREGLGMKIVKNEAYGLHQFPTTNND